MIVKIFGPQAQAVGEREITVEVDGCSSAAEVFLAIGKRYPALADSLHSSRLAVNHEYVTSDHRIAPDDEVALIGQVAGG